MQTDRRGTLATMVGSFAGQYNCCSLHFAGAETGDLPAMLHAYSQNFLRMSFS